MARRENIALNLSKNEEPVTLVSDPNKPLVGYAFRFSQWLCVFRCLCCECSADDETQHSCLHYH